ncbi:class I SAM-dependent methyltransferase [Jannaschia seohaensis]|uniref:Ubiquinone/menaquinone biosynthesis C-methylase UbiE n=1 Tax=Jannaschia seohaensis TaxID=475081 RepID=A0A2Y9A266_9RHOB|nr:methyltransferase domain-containing protein [Jannaschia seohaensis]PWJ22272.1 ubiquinone/menaquinone biosynthesis C-methylase UbiE [Jannaschia seohaensis]SSA38550.1 Ubiquinone/menaquinone biosynthesis C-methylase UbiE [Jannaschia seohaensis]
MNTGWQLSGGAAERYEAYLVPVIFAPWAQDLLDRAGVGRGDRGLDLACGTGIVARLAAARGGEPTGLDVNEGMLAAARAHPQGQGLRFVVGDAGGLPLEDAAFDHVICQQGFQFFPDRDAALRECHRVLRPGGRAIFCTARGLDENPLMQAQVTALSAQFGPEAAGPIRAVCGFPDAEATGAAFENAGFETDIETVVLMLEAPDGPAFVEGLLKSTPVAERIAALNPPARTALRDAVLDAFGACYDGRSLRFPHSANVVSAARP